MIIPRLRATGRAVVHCRVRRRFSSASPLQKNEKAAVSSTGQSSAPASAMSRRVLREVVRVRPFPRAMCVELHGFAVSRHCVHLNCCCCGDCVRRHCSQPNSGSTARDHLANERTFLAYCRTGMGFFGASVGTSTVLVRTMSSCGW